MAGQFWASVANVPLFLVYLLVAFALLWLFKAAYLRVTPYPEIELIRQGNTAAAVSLGGSMLGFPWPWAG
ncbi:MAG: DUF350 domain-containing protein [Candidatus Competibacteraceae bacterium]|nr:DUF350 domain-containing protein [Candidatus Competibacteraceae bacterium]